MSVLTEIEEKAMSLSKKDRGQLASKLLASLGSPFDDDDEDVIELALKRDREMDEDPDTVMSEEEFWASLDEFRRQ
jgi:hypothetical protein